MCDVRVEAVSEGLIPSERVVMVPTADGPPEEVTVSASAVQDNALRAGYIGRDGDRVLIELPRESASGRWRLWVNAEQIVR